MSRLAPVVAVALLALRAAPANAEPLDLDLSVLGPPDQDVWAYIGSRPGNAPPTAGEALALASDAKRRFAILSSELALALSGPILEPASTTGFVGFDLAFEGGYQTVHDDPVGTAAFGFGTTPWAGAGGTSPSSVTTTGIHVRKALPFSFELGGRLTYLNRSSYFAAQGEAKWALNEGYDAIPDLAVRIAYTRLFGQEQWNLGTTDVDFVVSKRWGVSAVTSFTPYLAARFTSVSASSDRIDFQSQVVAPGAPPLLPDEQSAAWAGFPHLRVGLYRTTLGVRMTASVVTVAAEATYFGGKDYAGKDQPAASEYPDFSLASSLAYAVQLGWEF